MPAMSRFPTASFSPFQKGEEKNWDGTRESRTKFSSTSLSPSFGKESDKAEFFRE
jgi:hypothetical protein